MLYDNPCIIVRETICCEAHKSKAILTSCDMFILLQQASTPTPYHYRHMHVLHADVETLGAAAKDYAELSGRTEVNFVDFVQAYCDVVRRKPNKCIQCIATIKLIFLQFVVVSTL